MNDSHVIEVVILVSALVALLGGVYMLFCVIGV